MASLNQRSHHPAQQYEDTVSELSHIQPKNSQKRHVVMEVGRYNKIINIDRFVPGNNSSQRDSICPSHKSDLIKYFTLGERRNAIIVSAFTLTHG